MKARTLHSRTRQKSTLGEELAHIVLGHPPSILDPATGLRTYNTDVESEAYAVGAAMILPYSQLFNAVKQGQSERALASRYEVSVAFVRARINRTGLRRMYQKRAGV
jgi:Zn-dependent peptidase ImmA (M78 family)